MTLHPSSEILLRTERSGGDYATTPPSFQAASAAPRHAHPNPNRNRYRVSILIPILTGISVFLRFL
jgi:hypothetical protein